VGTATPTAVPQRWQNLAPGLSSAAQAEQVAPASGAPQLEQYLPVGAAPQEGQVVDCSGEVGDAIGLKILRRGHLRSQSMQSGATFLGPTERVRAVSSVDGSYQFITP